MLLAVVAAAALLHGVMTLSERRAAFVSSVTHELRTPLTTFRMYAEMLARGMVPDAARRQEYFDTLQREAERLTLLVENVLAYARLERGRKPQAQDRVTVVDLLERVGPRLQQRAAQAGMECDVELDAARGRAGIHDGSERRRADSLQPGRQRGQVCRERDGPADSCRGQSQRPVDATGRCAITGRASTQRRWSRRMQAVRQECRGIGRDGAGVGLGLALCRRLARQLGGRLEVAATPGGGATVTLLLPV